VSEEPYAQVDVYQEFYMDGGQRYYRWRMEVIEAPENGFFYNNFLHIGETPNEVLTGGWIANPVDEWRPGMPDPSGTIPIPSDELYDCWAQWDVHVTYHFPEQEVFIDEAIRSRVPECQDVPPTPTPAPTQGPIGPVMPTPTPTEGEGSPTPPPLGLGTEVRLRVQKQVCDDPACTTSHRGAYGEVRGLQTVVLSPDGAVLWDGPVALNVAGEADFFWAAGTAPSQALICLSEPEAAMPHLQDGQFMLDDALARKHKLGGQVVCERVMPVGSETNIVQFWNRAVQASVDMEVRGDPQGILTVDGQGADLRVRITTDQPWTLTPTGETRGSTKSVEGALVWRLPILSALEWTAFSIEGPAVEGTVEAVVYAGDQVVARHEIPVAEAAWTDEWTPLGGAADRMLRDGVYVVQPGDRLSDIAAEFGLSWREIVQANRELLANPDRLEIGWRLLIP
jgi:hypothetical protein